MRIIESIPQWSPYPHGTNAVACTETMQSIDHAASFFMDSAPGDAPPLGPLTAEMQTGPTWDEWKRGMESWREYRRHEAERHIAANVRFGETIPVQKIEPMEFRTLEPMVPVDTVIGFYGPCAEGNRALVQLSISREQAAKIEEGTKPVSMGYSDRTTPLGVRIETCAPNAREWLESDGIPEAIGDTDHEDTKPCAPRNSTPIIEGAPEDRERYPGKSLAW